MPVSHEELALKCSHFCTKYWTILTLPCGAIQQKTILGIVASCCRA